MLRVKRDFFMGLMFDAIMQYFFLSFKRVYTCPNYPKTGTRSHF